MSRTELLSLLNQIQSREMAFGKWYSEEAYSEESARGEISDQDHADDGLACQGQTQLGISTVMVRLLLVKWGHDWQQRSLKRMTATEWQKVARFLLAYGQLYGLRAGRNI